MEKQAFWTLSSSPLNGGGEGGGGFSMCFDLNFSKMSTFWKLLHNFLSYKGICRAVRFNPTNMADFGGQVAILDPTP